jgi:hypothetical protein
MELPVEWQSREETRGRAHAGQKHYKSEMNRTCTNAVLSEERHDGDLFPIRACANAHCEPTFAKHDESSEDARPYDSCKAAS